MHPSWMDSRRCVFCLVVLLAGVVGCPAPQRSIAVAPPASAKSYALCFWNAENFYDDDNNPNEIDDSEDFFGTHPEMFNVKVERLSDALLKMNDYTGPDIVVLCEVESERALKALLDRLNQKLDKVGKADAKYQHILFKEDRTGRGFAPAIITRLPVIADKTVQLGKTAMKRILRGHVLVNGHELIIIAAHWTSRVTDKDDDGRKRAIYADACYGEFRRIVESNANADVIVCGDFNDELTDTSMRVNLHATGDEQTVIQDEKTPRLFDLCSKFDGKKDPKGTIYGRGKWSVFDHICVSRGLLDAKGWTCDAKETVIFAPEEMRFGKEKTPFHFGNAKQIGVRGYSDHFPVVTKLRVQP